MARSTKKAELLRTKLPKRLEESATWAINTFRTSEEFRLAAEEWNRKVLILIFKKASRDVQCVDTNFLLDQFPFSKDYLALKDREAEEVKVTEEEESEGEIDSYRGSASAHGTPPTSPSKEASSTAPAPEPQDNPPVLPSPPKDSTTPSS